MERLHKDCRQSWVRTYYPSFEGLRGLAILAVVFCHYGPLLWASQFTAWWWVGVDLFFVLSGFLITGNLFQTLHSKTYYSTFYQRRALRIFPLYYGLIGLFYVISWASPHLRVRGAFGLNAVYLTNLAIPFLNWNRENPTIVDFYFHQMRTHLEIALGVFWTLCIEEQFYLVWPVVMRYLGTRKRILRFCAIAVLVVPALRILLFFTVPDSILAKHLLYEATYTRCDELLLGAWCAVWLRGVRFSRSELRKKAYLVGSISTALFVLGVSLTLGSPLDDFNHITQPFVSTLGYSLIGLTALSILLISLDATHPLTRLLCWRPMRELGKVSYGMYLFHMVPLALFTYYLDRGLRQHHLAAVGLVGLTVLVYGAAWVSFHYFESPIMRAGRSYLAARNEQRSVPKSFGLVLTPSAWATGRGKTDISRGQAAGADNRESLRLLHKPTGT